MNTGISLNERFTQMQSKQPPQGRGRSRSRSRSRRIVDSGAGNPGVSAANSRLLQEFKRRHTAQTALKLKRRSLRTTGVSGRGARVGGVKSLRLAPNGKPMRSNNVTRVATMRADLVASGNAARNRRSGSSTRFSVSGGGGGGLRQRLGQRRPSVGGAAERIERRQRQQQQQQAPRGRSRSRSRSRPPQPQRADRGRSQSRGRSVGRSQSRNRDRSAQGRIPVKQRLSVKHRLGVRPGQGNNKTNQVKNTRQRRAPSKLRGVAGGRVEKRRNAQASQKKGISASLAGRQGRPRGRSALRNAAAANNTAPARRSRSRNRVAATAAAAAPATAKGRANPRQRRGRSAGAAKGKNTSNTNNKNGKTNKNSKARAANVGKQGPQQEARRGRSRSRKPAGKPQRAEVKREDLDMELDQYMSTTKSEMDYLLK
ncbi:serine/arginine repetitive matrix protein 2 [Drosophila ficusphila]|uniref:serine/arginine repetitive matrix protein 2 n=1 Tax=Drosophila ficusphila TaxID=30025 RepID=UPI0007E8953D|nr:serine/arginine repetitive matrix protein 2 [Drosophila ficusphila]